MNATNKRPQRKLSQLLRKNQAHERRFDPIKQNPRARDFVADAGRKRVQWEDPGHHQVAADGSGQEESAEARPIQGETEEVRVFAYVGQEGESETDDFDGSPTQKDQELPDKIEYHQIDCEEEGCG